MNKRIITNTIESINDFIKVLKDIAITLKLNKINLRYILGFFFIAWLLIHAWKGIIICAVLFIGFLFIQQHYNKISTTQYLSELTKEWLDIKAKSATSKFIPFLVLCCFTIMCTTSLEIVKLTKERNTAEQQLITIQQEKDEIKTKNEKLQKENESLQRENGEIITEDDEEEEYSEYEFSDTTSLNHSNEY